MQGNVVIVLLCFIYQFVKNLHNQVDTAANLLSRDEMAFIKANCKISFVRLEYDL